MTTATPSISEQPGGYVPGVCNINRAETAYRRRVGYIGLGLALILTAVFLLVAAIPRFVRVVLYVPYFISLIGFLQARNHFCVSYASSNQHNALDDGKPTDITDTSAKTADKRKAQKITLQATIAAALITAVLVAIPQL